jgi:cobalt-zinc-cadmium efflux system outer membrane protein
MGEIRERRAPRRAARARTRLTAVLAACLAGCVLGEKQPAPPVELPPPRSSPAPAPALPQPAAEPLTAEPGGDVPLTQKALLALAEKLHPVLSIARARIDAAEGRLTQVGLYPNPSATPRVDELGNRNGRGGMLAVTLTQEIVTAHKLKISQEAAKHGVEASDWQALTDYYDLRARVRMAYYELLTAGNEVAADREIVRITEAALAGAKKLEKAGAGTRLDVIRAEVEREQSQVRLAVAQRRLEAAGKLLAAAVGLPALPSGPDGPLVVGNLDKVSPALQWEPLLETMLSRSSELQQAQALTLQAEGLLRRAQADVCPNVLVSWRPIYNTIDHDFESLIEVGAAIPIWNRNQGNIRAARADVARTQAEARQVELRLRERLTLAYQRYTAARRQALAYRERIVPNARESLRLIRIGYEKGDPKYDFTSYIQAEQTLAQARVAEVLARGDLWRALAEIRGLLQDEAWCEE